MSKRLPDGACDSHAHVYPGGFAYDPGAPYEMPELNFSDYASFARPLGIDRTVFATPNLYGVDNSSLEATLKAAHGTGRGIANVRPDVDEETLVRLTRAGVCGARLFRHNRYGYGIENLGSMCERLAPHGWHVDFLPGQVSDIEPFGDVIERSTIPVVFDHLGKAKPSELDSPGFLTLLRLLTETDHVWVKLSSWYRQSDRPDFADMKPVALAILDARPDRVVWGSNWPHPGHHGETPSDEMLLDQALEWLGSDARIKQVFADNPARLYKF